VDGEFELTKDDVFAFVNRPGGMRRLQNARLRGAAERPIVD
jgi:hypothetical protein